MSWWFVRINYIFDMYTIHVIIETPKEIDLNIHPQDGANFKVVYHGGLVGEMFLDNGNWEAVSADDLDTGGYPIYEYDENSGHADILLDQDVITLIGRELDRMTGRTAV
jgi:hypothetical protein